MIVTLPKKPSSDNDTRVRNDFETKVSLPHRVPLQYLMIFSDILFGFPSVSEENKILSLVGWLFFKAYQHL